MSEEERQKFVPFYTRPCPISPLPGWIPVPGTSPTVPLIAPSPLRPVSFPTVCPGLQKGTGTRIYSTRATL